MTVSRAPTLRTTASNDGAERLVCSMEVTWWNRAPSCLGLAVSGSLPSSVFQKVGLTWSRNEAVGNQYSSF